MQEHDDAVVALALDERRNSMAGCDRFDALVSIALPLPRSGPSTVVLQQDRGEVCCLWDAAVLLARAMVDPRLFDPDFFRGKSVVDIGCGTGLLAITAARLGAARVVGTDLGETVAVARANGERNGVNAGGCHAADGGGVEWETLDWGGDRTTVRPPFDVVLASDVVYSVQDFPILVATLRDMCDGETEVFLCNEHRWRDVDAWLEKELAKYFTWRRIATMDDVIDIIVCKRKRWTLSQTYTD